MTRTLSGGETSESGVEVVWLMESVFWDGTSEVILRFTTAADDLTVDADGDGTAETYTGGVGDFLSWGGATETQDQRAQGTEVKFSGVSTDVMSTLLNNDFRGRRMRIWRGQVSGGDVVDTRLAWRGKQLEDYTIEEQRPDDEEKPITVEITTRVVSPVAALQSTNAVYTTTQSHDAMLARAGLSVGDTAYRYLPGLDRFFWGSEAPASATDGTNDGSTAGSGGSSGEQPTGPLFEPPF